jgi:hypothetical protein
VHFQNKKFVAKVKKYNISSAALVTKRLQEKHTII